MEGCSARPRAFLAAALAAILTGSSGQALAQAQQKPPPAQPNPTTVEEPVTKPEKPQEPTTPIASGPAHVPPDASGINLSEIDTRQLRLLYFDPAQTYLTPYIGRAFTNA